MNIDKELELIANYMKNPKGNPLRERPDYGQQDILSQLAEHAKLESLKKKQAVNKS